MALTKDQIVAAVRDVKIKPVDVPEWGPAFIRRLSGDERDAWDIWRLNNSVTEEDEKAGLGREGMLRPGTTGVRATLVSRALCDEEGNLLFEKHEIPILGCWDGNALDFLYDQIREDSGLSDEAAEEAGKNSDGPPSEDSG